MYICECVLCSHHKTQNNLQIEKFAYFDICFLSNTQKHHNLLKKQNIPNMNRGSGSPLEIPLYTPNKRSLNMTYASKLLCIREKLSLKQIDLAKKLGTSQKRISFWETGKFYPTSIFRFRIDKLYDETFKE